MNMDDFLIDNIDLSNQNKQNTNSNINNNSNNNDFNFNTNNNNNNNFMDMNDFLGENNNNNINIPQQKTNIDFNNLNKPNNFFGGNGGQTFFKTSSRVFAPAKCNTFPSGISFDMISPAFSNDFA